MRKWYEIKGKNSDVVIATRVKLLRNFKRYLFSPRITEQQSLELVKTVTDICLNHNVIPGELHVLKVNELNDVSSYALMERGIINKDLLHQSKPTGVLYNDEESLSIQVNTEDHICIQASTAGMNAIWCYEKAQEIEDKISEQEEFAFNEKYGYLTTSPMNVGTGLILSYDLFLPALSAAGKIRSLGSEISKYGVTIKGVFDDEKQSNSGIYRLTNQKTLGCSEQEMIENFNTIILQIIKQERVRREYALARKYSAIEDRIYRAYGVLKYARQIDMRDAVALLCQLELGIDSEIIEFSGDIAIFKMILEVQPNNLQLKYGKNVGSMTRERLRAEYINQKLPDIKNLDKQNKCN